VGFVIRRLLAIAPLVAWIGCASDAGSHKELQELRAEIRTLRQSNQALESRLSRLERQEVVAQARAAKPQGARPAAEGEMPELTVVKLKPRTEPAPALEVHTDVAEPSDEVVASLLEIARSEGGTTLDEGPEGSFDQGVAALKTGNLAGGAELLERFARQSPRHPQADNALYFAGLGRVGLEEFEAAAALFEQVLTRYPAGDAVQEAMLKLADCRVRLKEGARAKALYSRVISSYPGTPAAEHATRRLATLNR
jgi:TolA-binding protein